MTDNQLIIGLILLGGLMIAWALVRAGADDKDHYEQDDDLGMLCGTYVFPETTDEKRLEFMLQNCRKVVAEVAPPWGSNRLEIYVEEGFMGTLRYPHVEFCGAWEQGAPQCLAAQRAAIDAAMNAKSPEAN